jgi:hypothetical protein
LVEVPWLEWHAAHACNLSCSDCSHFSNQGHTGIVSLEELKQWYSGWHKRIAPKNLGILGGEPLLNKDIVNIISVTRDYWTQPEGGLYGIATNGLLLQRHPDLPKVLAETNCKMILTIHSDEDDYMEKLNPNLELVKEWEREYNIGVIYRNSSNHIWRKFYHGWGETFKPFQSKNAKSSWNNCPVGQDKCFQLFEGNIYKCAPLAYLNLQKKRWPTISDEWDEYLEYKPLTPEATDDEIIEFYNRKEEKYCTMCPEHTVHAKREKPMIPIKVNIEKPKISFE